ncbi:MAG TPA: dephospho-CoA kinase [Saprospiraceae bacterium]|nr:dephospho-CoA kinase [Saprospiraceae bacterium]
MYKVGITGGIASGKSTICKIFELLGVPVYYADDRAKRLMTASKSIKHQIITVFGAEAYYKNGRLNRKHIGSIAFNDPFVLKKLNAIVHPAVIQDGLDWFENLKDFPYALKEAALLIESGSYKSLDKTIVVTCPEEIRLLRAAKRDKAKVTDIKSRMQNQMPDDERIKFADFIINNDGNDLLIPQILDIHLQILAQSKQNG